MKTKNIRYLLLTVAMCFAVVLLLSGLTDVHSASAQDLARFAITYPSTTANIYDPSGNVIGEGVHGGEVKCNANDICNKKTHLSFISPLISTAEYEYRYTRLQAIDLEARRVVVAGTGTISDNGQKGRFSFTSTIEDIGDGKISVRYDASNPVASFFIPSTPGLMQFD